MGRLPFQSPGSLARASVWLLCSLHAGGRTGRQRLQTSVPALC